MRAPLSQEQKQLELEQKDIQNQRDNETKLLVAQINSVAESQRFAMMNHDNEEANTLEREKMAETARQFNEKLSLDKQKQKDDARLKEKEIQVKKQSKKTN